ncbi:MAG TPA: SCO family protein [Burkholderiales bacterium]|jgi:protein SCO1/2|nr:SCO family protein [Burkholderiales bacterium]
MRLLRLVLVAGLVLFGGCQKPAEGFRSTDVTGASFGRDFELVGHDGKLRRLADFRGKVVVVFFGFTHCPDVCPTTLAELAAARRMLGERGERVQVLLVTVDPQRDTPELLSRYVTAFDPSFLGLTGSPQQIAAVAREFKVIYQKVAGKNPADYTMDHSAGTYIFDPAGRLRLYVGYGQGAEVFAHDIGRLLEAG